MTGATLEGTSRYEARFPDAAPGHFRTSLDGLVTSSIGLGTGGFLPQLEAEALRRYVDTITVAIAEGSNVIDTAINYAHEVAERVLGWTLRELAEVDSDVRSEVVVCTKGGYLPYGPDWFHTEFVATGRCQEEELVDGCHCLAPEFLADQVERSRRNLGLDTIDVYLIHNPENLLFAVGRDLFLERMASAFEVLEVAAAEGRIGRYGVATAEGFRKEGPLFHRLDDLIGAARQAGGPNHHFRVVQVPLNLAMMEATFLRNHTIDGRTVTLLEATEAAGITVIASIAMNRTRLPVGIPPTLRRICPDGLSDMQMALQFPRSCPGVTVALAGMSHPHHALENLRLRTVEPSDFTATYTGREIL